MSGLMRGGWKRGLVSGPQRLRSSAWTAPDHQGHRASLLLYPFAVALLDKEQGHARDLALATS